MIALLTVVSLAVGAATPPVLTLEDALTEAREKNLDLKVELSR